MITEVILKRSLPSILTLFCKGNKISNTTFFFEFFIGNKIDGA